MCVIKERLYAYPVDLASVVNERKAGSKDNEAV